MASLFEYCTCCRCGDAFGVEIGVSSGPISISLPPPPSPSGCGQSACSQMCGG